MAFRTTIPSAKSGLAALLLTLTFGVGAQSLSQHNLGKITHKKGKITYLPFTGALEARDISLSDAIVEGGSFLAHEGANFTVKLFDGSWLKVSPMSKFSLELDPEQKIITLNLYAGSVKVLFSGKLEAQGQKMDKFIVVSGDGKFETSESKFSVFRNILDNTNHVYVEKGLVRVSLRDLEDRHELVHTQEMTSIKDRHKEMESARKITERELKFLNSAFYLKNSKSEAF